VFPGESDPPNAHWRALARTIWAMQSSSRDASGCTLRSRCNARAGPAEHCAGPHVIELDGYVELAVCARIAAHCAAWPTIRWTPCNRALQPRRAHSALALQLTARLGRRLCRTPCYRALERCWAALCAYIAAPPRSLGEALRQMPCNRVLRPPGCTQRSPRSPARLGKHLCRTPPLGAPVKL